MAARGRTHPEADVQRLRGQIRDGAIPPCCVLHGEDTHRKELIAGTIVERVLGEGDRSLGLHRFDGQQHDLADVLQACLSLPMFAASQVVLVRHAQEMLRDAASQQRLLDYVARPAPGTTLLLDADQLDGRRGWVRSLKQSGALYHVPLPAGRDLIQWCHRLAREAGLSLTDEQAERLTDLVGDDLQLLRQELSRLALAVSALPGDASTEQALDELVARRQVDVFELVGSLGPGRVSEALALWQRFRGQGRDAMELIPLLSWRIRQLCSVLELADAGAGPGDAAGLLGVSPYAVRRILEQRRLWESARRREALAACRDLERDVKGGRMDPDTAVERFFMRLAG